MKLFDLLNEETEDDVLVKRADMAYKKLKSGEFNYDFEYAGTKIETKVHYILPEDAVFDVWSDKKDNDVKLPRATISDEILYVVEDDHLSEEEWDRNDFFIQISNLFFDQYQVILEHLNYGVDLDDLNLFNF